jgi:hypothetical protein
MVHACKIPALERLKQRNLEFEISLGYIVSPCLQKKRRCGIGEDAVPSLQLHVAWIEC